MAETTSLSNIKYCYHIGNDRTWEEFALRWDDRNEHDFSLIYLSIWSSRLHLRRWRCWSNWWHHHGRLRNLERWNFHDHPQCCHQGNHHIHRRIHHHIRRRIHLLDHLLDHHHGLHQVHLLDRLQDRLLDHLQDHLLNRLRNRLQYRLQDHLQDHLRLHHRLRQQRRVGQRVLRRFEVL